MPVRFTNEATVINPPPSPRNSPRSSVTLRTPRTRQSGRDSRSPKTHSRGRKRKTKVKNAKKSKRGSQKKRGRRASRRGGGGEEWRKKLVEDGLAALNKEYTDRLKKIKAFFNNYQELTALEIREIASSYIQETKEQKSKDVGSEEPYILTHPFFKELQEITRPDKYTNKSISNYLRACNNCFKHPLMYDVDVNNQNISNLITFVIEILREAISGMEKYKAGKERECKINPKKSPPQKCDFNSFTFQIDFFLQGEGANKSDLISETDELGFTNYKIYTKISARYKTYL